MGFIAVVCTVRQIKYAPEKVLLHVRFQAHDMSIRILFALLSLLLFSYAHAQDLFAVIVSDTTGIFVGSQASTQLKKAEVVRILGQSGDILRVQRVDNPPDWEMLDEAHIQRARQPVTVLRQSIISLREFRRVTSWDAKARNTYIACDGSCDYGVSYRFKSDGSYIAKDGPNDNSSQKISGHLYAYKDIYWARSGTGWSASRYSVFFIRGELDICDMITCAQY